jgi:hypothetical protein
MPAATNLGSTSPAQAGPRVHTIRVRRLSRNLDIHPPLII